jgi:hypothetical protein
MKLVQATFARYLIGERATADAMTLLYELISLLVVMIINRGQRNGQVLFPDPKTMAAFLQRRIIIS